MAWTKTQEKSDEQHRRCDGSGGSAVIVNHPPPPETLHQYTGPTSCITDKLVHEIVLESAGFDFRVQIYFTTSSKTLVTLCVVLIFDSFFFLVVNVPTSHCEQ